MPSDHHFHSERCDVHLATRRTGSRFTTVVTATASFLEGMAAGELGGGELDAADGRLPGARCRTRQMIELTKGADRDGWSKSKWLWWGESHGNERTRVWVSDSGAEGRDLRGQVR